MFRSAYLVAQQLQEHPITEVVVFALAAVQLRMLAGLCPSKAGSRILEDAATAFEGASDRIAVEADQVSRRFVADEPLDQDPRGGARSAESHLRAV